MLRWNKLKYSKSFKKKLSSKKGLTLLEVIISIAILGIMAISFLSMFSSGIVGIFKSGQNSTSHYEAQNKLESTISDASITGAAVSTPGNLQLNFSGKNYTITGRKVDVDYNFSNHSKKLTTFTSN